MSLMEQLFPYPPTDEQGGILKGVFSEQFKILINAGAGTGKSSTLLMSVVEIIERFMKKGMAQRIIILQFNRDNAIEMNEKLTALFEQSSSSISEDLARYQSKVNAIHQDSFVMREMTGQAPNEHSKIMARFDMNGVKSSEINNYFKTVSRRMPLESIRGKDHKNIQPAMLAFLIFKAVNRFMQSSDEKPNKNMISFEDFPIEIDQHKKNEIKAYLEPYLKEVAQDLLSDNGVLKVGFAAMFKRLIILCQDPEHPMSLPIIDTLMVDEFQDSNDIMVQFIQLFADDGAKIICVGDDDQAIYGFRGASNQMQHHFFKDAANYPLTGSFRFGPKIGKLACDVINYFKPTSSVQTPVVGIKPNPESSAFKRLSLRDADMILCRTNKGLREVLAALKKDGVDLGDVYIPKKQPILVDITGMVSLRDNGWSTHPEYKPFNNDFQGLVEYSETDEGKSLKNLVEIVNSHNEKELINMINSCSDDIHSKTKVVTAHKSKGLEAEKVILWSDFDSRIKKNKYYGPNSSSDKKRIYMDREEANLLYVAITRAQSVIDYSRIDRLQDEPLFDLSLAEKHQKKNIKHPRTKIAF